ncbi:hypothetical protein M409DRAFT_57352 [Zasmidium cellare ATCC 36951]|uniref:Zn(2)-C6 fungal-type domain-containing protein n=1 Tax=Zasmidium cellare ATCC 36951 TaxID=1080233 RepID=A0A6A6C8T1_ZASCE|nr:uncharacterized protein M409DRAFT_57352 [Zasmidium cellare ATCC 36951]KAF2163445.1 hypothetical protein M409DRAFT_57352 [Zasmidium cellare ATCC 36951]
MDVADGTTPNRTRYRAIKAHRKSRAGCFTCKGRRIKCCETRPRCVNCSRGNLHCVYPETRPTTISVQPGGVQYQSRGFSLKDMRFFHDFMTASYPHLPLECDHAWTNDIPLLAQQVRHSSSQARLSRELTVSLGAAHLHRNTDLELKGTVEQHRAMALCGLVEPQSDLCTHGTGREGRLNAQLATAYALNFTASYMGDTMSSFLTFVRGCASLSREIIFSGYSSPFFPQDGHTMLPEHHTQIMTRRLQGARLAPFPDNDEIQKAKRSLSYAARVCTFTPVEVEMLVELQNVLDKNTEPIKAT